MKTFYSNCFFEALKAKLKDWKNVEIIYLPKELAFRSRFGHFLWKNKTTNNYFHFTRNGLPGDHYCNFCFKGFIEKTSKKDIEKQANSEIKRRAHFLENKYGLKLEIMEKERINSFDSWTSWTLMSDGDSLPSIESFYANGGSSAMEPIILATCYKDFGSPYQKLLVFNKSTGELKTKFLPNEKIAMWRWTTCEPGDLSEREIEDFNAKSSTL